MLKRGCQHKIHKEKTQNKLVSNCRELSFNRKKLKKQLICKNLFYTRLLE